MTRPSFRMGSQAGKDIVVVIRFLGISLLSMVVACGGGSGTANPVSETPQPSVTPTPTPTPITSPSGEKVNISGLLSFDFVPPLPVGGLDYEATDSRPIRGATVQALSDNDSLLAQTISNSNGHYRLGVDQNTNVRIRVRAELRQTGTPSWHFSVTDNTSGNALYVLEGSSINSETTDSTRDLHAPSGWTGTGYGDRVAAPFAILDAVYEAKQLLLQADPSLHFPTAELRWSIDNIASFGDRNDGLIGTSFYDPSENNMYILGHADNDTDEYDRSVILHEWAHYFEDTLSRSDSIGGSHDLRQAYDMRLAFGEGFANAFSGIAGKSEFYLDSSGLNQANTFGFSLEQNNFDNRGWFSENSIGQIVYDLADDNNEEADTLALGFTPIFHAMTADPYTGSPALTSIFLFTQSLKNISGASTGLAVDLLLQTENIFGEGYYGEGETNDSDFDITFALPIYQTLAVGGTINVCGNNRVAEYNGLDVRRHIRVNIPSSRRYTVNAEKTLGTGDKDPDILVLRQGRPVAFFNSSNVDIESGTASLVAGEHILEVYDYLNIDGNDGGGSSCFNVSII